MSLITELIINVLK